MSELPPPPGTELTTQVGQLSPDGRYRWDGHGWQPANPQAAPLAQPPAPVFTNQFPAVQHVDMRAGAAFRLGFFAFFGAGCASLVFWVLAVIVVSLLGGLGALGLGALGSHT